jgi:hypothetical protein
VADAEVGAGVLREPNLIPDQLVQGSVEGLEVLPELGLIHTLDKAVQCV